MAPYGHPLALVASTFAAACLVAMVTDRFAMPVQARRPQAAASASQQSAGDMVARVAVIGVVYAIFFAISWRPLYAFAGTVSTFAIFTLISRAKFEFIREPLVFSDIALALLVFRHKEMFYATWLNVAFWLVSLTYVFGASALFMIFEPSLLPPTAGFGAVLMMIAVAAAPVLILFAGPAREMLSRLSAGLIGGSDVRHLTWRLGTLTSVSYGFLAWLGVRRRPSEAGQATAAAPIATGGDIGRTANRPLIVVWQSESFIDMRHFGVTSLMLPNLDRLRLRSAAWGRMSTIFEGGYTLRTEFSVISGLPPEALGPDATHPYLNAPTYADVSWPTRLRKAGWSTHFLHPYDRRFFSRERALPQLGFEALTMLDGFDHDREHDGPYVSDLTLSKRVLDYCRDDRGLPGQFLFAASMENHGPWHPAHGRDADNPVDVYLAILERSDEALGYLADELDRLDRPVWLAFYGDHAPILKSFADPFPDARTDYLIVPMSKARNAHAVPVEPTEKAPWNIIRDLMGLAGLDATLQPVGVVS